MNEDAAAVAHLRRIAASTGVDPDDAVRVAVDLARRRGEGTELAAAALVQQLEAGVDLDAAASALASADDTDP